LIPTLDPEPLRATIAEDETMPAGIDDRVERAENARAVVHSTQDGIRATISDLSDSQLTGPSYCDDWTLAQVLSHLGSQSEIFTAVIDAALKGENPPGPDSFPPIWDRWNSKSPVQQRDDFKAADKAFMEKIDALDAAELGAFQVSMFGMDLDAAQVLTMRESELALHGWDLAVALNPDARLSTDAVDLLMGAVGTRLPRSAKPIGRPLTLLIETTDPARSFLLDLDQDVKVEENPDKDNPTLDGAARIRIPSEAFLRLVAGRLDPDHTPDGIQTAGITLDEIRHVFPGF
jgi:uncharacterized protein (TIGR03083 family)